MPSIIKIIAGSMYKAMSIYMLIKFTKKYGNGIWSNQMGR